MDETSITVKGPGTYSDRAVEKQSTTIDCLFPATRNRTAARRCFKNAITNTGTPSLVTSEQRGAHTAGLQQVNREPHTQYDSSVHISEQDDRTRSPTHHKTDTTHAWLQNLLRGAAHLGIAVMAMIKQGHMQIRAGKEPTPAHMFYALAA
jgi:transposase-like protein